MGTCIVYTGIRLLLLIHPFISSFSFLTHFQALKILSEFSWELLGLEGWNFLQTWTVGWCIMHTKISLLLLIHFFSSSFFFLSSFQRLKILSHFSQELWVLESWKLVYNRTMGGCIMYTTNKLLLIYPFFYIFLSLQFSKIKSFCHTFLRNCKA